ncbi:sigma-54 interaction domain-containing protein [Desulfogranum mediterraneum]|uniref:sigma-54 interaction domain-containing protein n=1 Tax=Desulfogranum mediterraneum TaxID=160661 RepID=UPI0004089B44|nr:sigma-54-dependent Fis family transcriptional regulator [Desulfogranum mediterraneum]
MDADRAFQSRLECGELLNSIPHGVALLDRRLCLVTMNRTLEAMTGYQALEARGVYGDYILRTDLGSNDQLSRQVLADGKTVARDTTIINTSRTTIPVHCTLSRLHDQQGQPVGLVMVLEDISLLQQAGPGLGAEVRSEIIGHSQEMEAVFELMAVLARTDAAVLVTGETGTGKDKIAEQLHQSSPRARHRFVKVNCGALPEALLESELFGHVKGAFTGAVADRAGMFKLADKGTIFLTEIGDLSLPLQVKLLSVLDDQEFYPVGGSTKLKVNVRIIAATHHRLREEVEQGRFREDLFYRLNVLNLHMPPLRERSGDVQLLLEHFVQHFNRVHGRNIQGVSDEARALLESYPYPGNVRELRNLVEFAVNLCPGGQLGIKDLPRYLSRQPAAPRLQRTAASLPAASALSGELRPRAWPELERQQIVDALLASGGNRTRAAAALGWGRTTLWRKMIKYQLV